jgi:hypothetical protein
MGVETGSGTLAGLLASLPAIDGEVFIRAAARTGSRAVWHVDAVVAPPAEPPGWQPQVLHEQLPWQHKPSRARYDSVVLPWPARIFQPWIQNRPGGEQLPQGYVIGDNCPSFPSYQAAFRAFFYGTSPGRPAGRCRPASGWCASPAAARG